MMNKMFEKWWGNRGEKWNGKLDIKQFSSEAWTAALSESHKDIPELEKNQLPPLTKDCPECSGDGYILRVNAFSEPFPLECCVCNGTGKVYNYLTPEQYVSWMRDHEHPDYEIIDSDPIWCLTFFVTSRVIIDPTISPWWELHTYKCKTENIKDNCGGNIYISFIVARQGQPAPPNDWRPEQ